MSNTPEVQGNQTQTVQGGQTVGKSETELLALVNERLFGRKEEPQQETADEAETSDAQEETTDDQAADTSEEGDEQVDETTDEEEGDQEDNPDESESDEETKDQSEEHVEEEAQPWDEVKDVLLEVPIVVDGKEERQKMTLEQLRSGVMMQKDYQNKTKQLAENRRLAEVEYQQKMEAAQKSLTDSLQQVEMVLVKSLAPGLNISEQDRNTLADTDPSAYFKLQRTEESLKKALEWAKENQRSIEAERQKKFLEDRHQAATQSIQILQRDIPGWGPDYMDRLVKVAQGYGFTQPETDGLIDYRMVKVLDDAAKWNALQKDKPEAVKKVRKAPKLKIKAGARKTQSERSTIRQQQLKKRMMESGGTNDQAAIDYIVSKFRK